MKQFVLFLLAGLLFAGDADAQRRRHRHSPRCGHVPAYHDNFERQRYHERRTHYGRRYERRHWRRSEWRREWYGDRRYWRHYPRPWRRGNTTSAG